jgi:Inositol polyphosphate kinase
MASSKKGKGGSCTSPKYGGSWPISKSIVGDLDARVKDRQFLQGNNIMKYIGHPKSHSLPFCHANVRFHFCEKINPDDKGVCDATVNAAIRRASQWISFQLSAEDGSVMVGQVGGISIHKRPLLTLEPDYVMKPVQTDHRGMREIFLYEAVKVLSKNQSSQQYASLLTGAPYKQHYGNQQFSGQQSGNRNGIAITDWWDTLAMWFAMKMDDPVVAEYERAMNQSWKTLKKERDTLRRLATFIPSYYGVVGQRSPLSMPQGEVQAHKAVQGDNGSLLSASHFGMSLEAHLLLTDVTAKFRRPCVMDIKMGTQTYEPDASDDKRLREIGKYPQQETFGFRIVGMRIYDPSHFDADESGYRRFHKEYGRSLATIDDILGALRLFLSAGCVKRIDNEEEPRPDVDLNGSLNRLEEMESSMSPSSAVVAEALASIESIRLRASSNLLAELRPVIGFFEENKSLSFYGSSLLLVYEGDRTAPNPDVATVKMIDFGRVQRQPHGDPGYLQGLRTIKSLFDKLRKGEKQRLQTAMSVLPAASS